MRVVGTPAIAALLLIWVSGVLAQEGASSSGDAHPRSSSASGEGAGQGNAVSAPAKPTPEILETIPVPVAKEPPPPRIAEDGGAVRLEQVTVTASKRAESERKVAGAVTAMTGEHLAEIGAHNFKDY